MKYITHHLSFTNSKKIIGEKIALISHSRYLGFLTTAYTMALVFANWFDPRLINFMGLNTGAGAIIFPFTYLFSDIITEVYGYKNARLAVWVGLFFNCIFIFIVLSKIFQMHLLIFKLLFKISISCRSKYILQ